MCSGEGTSPASPEEQSLSSVGDGIGWVGHGAYSGEWQRPRTRVEAAGEGREQGWRVALEPQ